jgi:HNH endonuclease/NUMOD4 motif
VDATQEEWRPITGTEGGYEISNHGRARSAERYVVDRRGIPRRLSSRMLVPRPTPTGYLRIQVFKKDQYIHRLVLEEFVGPCPDGMEACHNDGDRSNNTPDNLRWDTRLGNCQDIIAHGTHANLQKTHCPRGHEYDGWANGWKSELTGQRKKRICKTCRRDRHRAKKVA